MSEQRRRVTERCALSLVLAGLFGQMKYFVHQPVHLVPRLFDGAKHGRRRAWLSHLQEEARILIQLLKQLYLDMQPEKCFHNPVVDRLATRSQEESLSFLSESDCVSLRSFSPFWRWIWAVVKCPRRKSSETNII